MSAPDGKVVCPHCGAENRVSMILSLCSQCRQPLESAPSRAERDGALQSEDEAPAEPRRTVDCPKCHRTCWAASENCPICGADLRHRWVSHIGCLSIACGILAVPLVALISHWHPVLRTWLSYSQMQTVKAASPFLWCAAGGLIVIGILILACRSSGKKPPPPTDPDWRAFAEEVGVGSFTGGQPPEWRMEVDHKAWTVVLDTYCRRKTQVGENVKTREGTRCRAPFLLQRPVGLRAVGGGWRARALLGSHGVQELEEWVGPVNKTRTGDRAFDRAYAVRSSDEELARALFAEPVIREVLLAYGFGTELRVEPLELCRWRARGECTFDETPAPKPQRGDSETMAVVFQTPTLVVEAEGLRRLHQLMKALLDKLCELGVASEEPPRVDIDGKPRRLPPPEVEAEDRPEAVEGPVVPPTIDLPPAPDFPESVETEPEAPEPSEPPAEVTLEEREKAHLEEFEGTLAELPSWYPRGLVRPQLARRARELAAAEATAAGQKVPLPEVGPPPRSIPLVWAGVLFGGFLNQFAWFFFGIASWCFGIARLASGAPHDRGSADAGVVFTVVWAIALLIVVLLLRRGLRAAYLLTIGRAAEGKVKSVTDTGAWAGSPSNKVYRLVVEFQDAADQQHEMQAKRTTIARPQAGQRELVLYNPRKPESAVLLDSLAVPLKVDEAGRIRPENPGLARASLIIPFLAVVVPCLMYWFFSTVETRW